MADRKLIDEYKLSEAVNRFKQINEYTFITSAPLTEEGDDDGSQQQDANGENAVQDPASDNVQQPSMDGNGGQQAMPQQPMGDEGMPTQTGQNPPQGVTPPPIDGNVAPVQPTVDDAGTSATDDGIQTDDEVIDVDDLTDAQEDTEEKVDGVSHQLLRLLKVVGKYNDAIERQNKEIESLKKEFEKRNPTEEEQLNIRSQAGYPYSEQPKEYWEKKVKDNPNYDVMFDNDVPTNKEQEEFKIKDSDLNNINYKNISDSFDDDMRLTDFLNF